MKAYWRKFWDLFPTRPGKTDKKSKMKYRLHIYFSDARFLPEIVPGSLRQRPVVAHHLEKAEEGVQDEEDVVY